MPNVSRLYSLLCLGLLVISMAHSADEAFAVDVNFQHPRVATPTGYEADTGALFTAHTSGYSYGWSESVGRRDRTDAALGVTGSLVVMRNATWEIAVPNGVYDVSVVTGDIVRPNDINSLMIEGQYIADVDPLAANPVLTATVSVSDGRLSVAAANDAHNPTLCAISIAQNMTHTGAHDSHVHGLLSTWDQDGLKRVAVDPVIRYYWGGRSPWPGISGELFTAQWRGYIVADETAMHNLRFRFNESCRVWVGDNPEEPLIDAWYSGKTWYDEYADYEFTAGELVPITIEYRQRFQSSGIRMLWKPTPGADPANKETAYTHIPTGNLLPPNDLAVPSTPQEVGINYITDTRLQLYWQAASDDVQLSHYNVYRNGQRIASTISPSFIDTAIAIDTDYKYRVEAVDWLGKQSSFSAVAKTWVGLRVETGNRSATSPAWIEGTNGAGVQSLTASIEGGNTAEVVRLGQTRWGVDVSGGALGVPLIPEDRTNVSITATGNQGQTRTVARSIAWQTTFLPDEGDEEMVIRAGDAILLSVLTNRNRAAGIDIGDDGDVDYVGVGRQRFPITFDQAGIYEVVGVIDDNRDDELDWYSERRGTLTVRVIDVNFDGPIACEVGFQREKGVEVIPLSVADLPLWEAADTGLLDVRVIPDEELSEEVLNNPAYNPANYGKRLYLTAIQRGSPTLLARVPDTGALIGYQAVDEYTHNADTAQEIFINGNTGLGNSTYEMRPWIDDLDVIFEMFSHQSTFAGGATRLTSNTGSLPFEKVWDAETGEFIARLPFEIEMPDGEDSYCFSISVDQQSTHGTITNSTLNINGDGCKVSITELVLGIPDDCERGDLEVEVVERIDPKNVKDGQDTTLDVVGEDGAGTPSVESGAEIDCTVKEAHTFEVTSGGTTGYFDIILEGTDEEGNSVSYTFDDVVTVVDLLDVTVSDAFSDLSSLTIGGSSTEDTLVVCAGVDTDTATIELEATFEPSDADEDHFVWKVTGGSGANPTSGSFKDDPINIDLGTDGSDSGNTYDFEAGLDLDLDGTMDCIIHTFTVEVLQIDELELIDDNDDTNTSDLLADDVEDLIICAEPGEDVTVNLDSTVFVSGNEARFLYEWDSSSVTQQTGDLSEGDSISFTIARNGDGGFDDEYTIEVGCDANDDGSLDISEATFSGVVKIITLNSLSVKDTNNTSLSKMTSDTTVPRLLICKPMSGDAQITLEPDFNDPDGGENIVWRVDGDTATGSGSSQTFDGITTVDVTLAPTAGNSSHEFKVFVGCDANENGVLDDSPDEKFYQIDVVVIVVETVTITEQKLMESVTNPSDNDIALAQCSGHDKKIKIQVSGGPATSEAGKHVLWKIDETIGAGPTKGNFGGEDPFVEFNAGVVFSVDVGCDQNMDGTLQDGEVDISTEVLVGNDWSEIGTVSVELDDSLRKSLNSKLRAVGIGAKSKDGPIAKVEFSGKLEAADCADNSSTRSTIMDQGCRRSTATGSIKLVAKETPLIVPVLGKSGYSISGTLPLLIADIDFIVGVGFFWNLDTSIDATVGLIEDDCKPEVCPTASLGASATIGIVLKAEIIVCIDPIWGDEDCYDLSLGAAGASASFSLAGFYNKDSCEDGVSGEVCLKAVEGFVTVGGSLDPTDPDSSESISRKFTFGPLLGGCLSF